MVGQSLFLPLEEPLITSTEKSPAPGTKPHVLVKLADPAIDRLYILATLIVFLIRDIVPVWMIAVIIGRDLVLGVTTLLMNRKGLPPFTVTYLGKAATFNLLYAFPFLLLAQADGAWGSIAFVAGWSFAIWGIALYISTGISYAREGLSQMRGNRVINS
jgi:cardiolipin synthase (CMP-forming)